MANQRNKKPLPAKASPTAKTKAKGQQGMMMSEAEANKMMKKSPMMKKGMKGY